MKILTHLFGSAQPHFDWLVQERCNSIANALELRLSCTNTLIGRYISFAMWMDIWGLNFIIIFF